MSISFPKHPELASEVSAWLAAHDVKPTTFGKLAAGDPSLLASLQNGRELRSDTLRRIRHFMMTGGAKPIQRGAA